MEVRQGRKCPGSNNTRRRRTPVINLDEEKTVSWQQPTWSAWVGRLASEVDYRWLQHHFHTCDAGLIDYHNLGNLSFEGENITNQGSSMRVAPSAFAFAGFLLLLGCGGSSSPSTNTSPGLLSTSTVLTVSPNPVTAGASVTLTANVASVAGTPAGSVTFFDGTTTLATVTLTSGVATLSTSSLSAGTTHTLTASYAATANFAASTSPAVALVVNAVPPAATSLALTATPNPANAAATVTLTATITSTAGTPTGSIAFFDGSTSLGVVALNANGIATISTSTLDRKSTRLNSS